MKHKIKSVHFVGIGGVGMSGIAEVMLNLGYRVSGSDLQLSVLTQRLAEKGAAIYHGHAAGQIQQADVIVISTAVSNDNPEVVEARQRQLPVVPRATMLAELMRLQQGIAIAGTHGKTTTTSLVASILGHAGFDPTYVIGGRLNAAGLNAKLGQGDFMVVEADESDMSFLQLTPVMAVVTNIDADHMATYGHDFEQLKEAFVDFLHRLPFYGRAFLCRDDPTVREIIERLNKPFTTYGFDEHANVRAENIRSQGTQMHFDACWENGSSQRLPVTINSPGRHNVLNALAAIAVALEVGVEKKDIVAALEHFGGVGRRFQRYGDFSLVSGGHMTLIDDYGHHPAEISATLAAARGAFPDRRLVLVFQPHRYSRTRDLFEDFVEVLGMADVLVLTEVYAAGEPPIVAADGRALVRAVRMRGQVEPIFVADLSALPAILLQLAEDNDIVITMGAGSIGQVPVQLLSQTSGIIG